MSSSASTFSGVTVVTQVYPQQTGTQVYPQQTGTQVYPQQTGTQVYPQQIGTAQYAAHTAANVFPSMAKFLKGEPKALGVVQIMIGVINILFGIVMTIYADSFAVFSGIVFWGGLLYIISGALTVAADKKLARCLVRGSLGMNIVCTITAGTAVILLIIDFVVTVGYFPCNNYQCTYILDMYQTRSHGIIGVLLVCSVFEFIISICVSAFACKAVCCCAPEQAVFTQTQEAPINTVSQYPANPTENKHNIPYVSSVGQSHKSVVEIFGEKEPSLLQ